MFLLPFQQCHCLFQGFTGPLGPEGKMGPIGKPVGFFSHFVYVCVCKTCTKKKELLHADIQTFTVCIL